MRAFLTFPPCCMIFASTLHVSQDLRLVLGEAILGGKKKDFSEADYLF
jgi:hypothetical protein